VRAAILAAFVLFCGCASAPAQRLERGVVAAPERHAADVGAAILRKGGNAVDASVAVAFALAVTFPEAGNLGGGGFMLVHHEGEPDVAIDYRETAPRRATRDMFLDEKGNVVPGRSLRTHLASGVPGTVAGLWEAHRRAGSLPWADLVEPAIHLAEDGFDLDPRVARRIDEARESKDAHPSFAKYFPPGKRLVQKELAATLRRIAEQGADGFYRGETAKLIADEMRKGGGLIDEEDLVSYKAKVREPVSGTYRRRRVVSMPPPSSGGVALIEMLNLWEVSPAAAIGGFTMLGAPRFGAICGIENIVFADRSAWLGDPDFFDVPVAKLTSKEWAPRRIEDCQGRPISPANVHPGAAREKDQTTHFSIVDKWGGAVSNTTTLNDSFGSGLVVSGAGFLLNNEMDDFSSKPGAPNMYGVTGGEANAIAPGKRMLSSMSPTFVYDEKSRLWLVLGTPGGPTIFTTVFQVIVNRIDRVMGGTMTLEQAVAAPRFHHQWPPFDSKHDSVRVESEDDARIFKDMGFTIELRKIGDVQAIEIQDHHAIGASDPRGVGAVASE
jgi:gamma-glutamyltranspeptidase/glutathione hydrolase